MQELQNMYLKLLYLQIEQSEINVNFVEPDQHGGFKIILLWSIVRLLELPLY